MNSGQRPRTVFEIWESSSLPWHALQRSVAKTLEPYADRTDVPGATAAGNWLVRARSTTPPAHQAAR